MSIASLKLPRIGEIEIDSFSWTDTTPMSDISITREQDWASPSVKSACEAGEWFEGAVLSVNGEKGATGFSLKDVILKLYVMGESAHGKSGESFTLNYKS